MDTALPAHVKPLVWDSCPDIFRYRPDIRTFCAEISRLNANLAQVFPPQCLITLFFLTRLQTNPCKRLGQWQFAVIHFEFDLVTLSFAHSQRTPTTLKGKLVKVCRLEQWKIHGSLSIKVPQLFNNYVYLPQFFTVILSHFWWRFQYTTFLTVLFL